MKEKQTPKYPFVVGDLVRFSPSERTRGHYQDIARFGIQPGAEYQITNIVDEVYLYFNQGGGWPWNEFELVKKFD